MRVNPTIVRVAATHTRLAGTHDLVSKQFLRPSDWLMRSELGYFAYECNQFVTDGHFQKFQSLKACEK